MARSVTKSAQKGLHHKKHGAGHYVAWACFIFILLITVFPFFWMLRSSFASNAALI